MSGQAQLPLPASNAGATPAAAYVRMSTEHQQYSTENQLDRIKEYAARRRFEIVRVFADEGKSGLSAKNRDGLQRMIAEVESGQAEFKAILVYDVSRWGRFQDADESGFFEYKCKCAGVAVHYVYDTVNDVGEDAREERDGELLLAAELRSRAILCGWRHPSPTPLGIADGKVAGARGCTRMPDYSARAQKRQC